MTFFFRKGWQVQLTEADLKTPRMFTFADPEKIRELARRGEALVSIRSETDAGAWDRDWQGWGLPTSGGFVEVS
jgi:hypothetical protein